MNQSKRLADYPLDQGWRSEAGAVTSTLWEVCAIVTDRLVLTPIEPRDAESIVRWRACPANQAQFWADRGPTLEEQRAWMAAPRDGRVDYSIRRVGTPTPIGTVSLASHDPQTSTAEIGTVLDETQRGLGFAREANTAWLAYAFNVLRLRSLTAYIRHDNRPSMRLFRALGFREAPTGVSRHHPIKGLFRPLVLTAEDPSTVGESRLSFVSFRVADTLLAAEQERAVD